MFRRPIRRPVGRRPVGNVPPALQRANQLMVAGQYAEAAGIFEQFARGAQNRDGPRAPWFFLQAGRAHLLSGQVQAGMANVKQGLSILAIRGQLQQLQKVGVRLVADLNERGYGTEAKQVEDLLQTQGAGISIQETESNAEGNSTRRLPTSCPGCGGPLRSDELAWIDDSTAECPYCGNMVRAA